MRILNLNLSKNIGVEMFNLLNQNEIDVDDIFAYNVAHNVKENNEDLESKSIEECRCTNDRPK